MKMYFCDICGKEIPEEIVLGEKFEDMNGCRKGRFRIDYQRAKINKDEKVIGFEYIDSAFCEQCEQRLESALWKELRSMTEGECKVSKIPMEPRMVRYDQQSAREALTAELWGDQS